MRPSNGYINKQPSAYCRKLPAKVLPFRLLRDFLGFVDGSERMVRRSVNRVEIERGVPDVDYVVPGSQIGRA